MWRVNGANSVTIPIRTAITRRLPTAAGALWMLVVGLAFLAPALARGVHFGPFGHLNTIGLNAIPGATVHNPLASDQVEELGPWTMLAWREVHAGHLPLWNPYSAMGLPLAFNFQSATFSLPMLIGYMFPAGLAYTVEFVVKMVIAGTGVLYLMRVLKCDLIAGIVGGTIFELSGAFTGWLGWPQSGTFCWIGWLLASGIVVVKTRRWSAVAVFAVSFAFAIYGGHPEAAGITSCVVVTILAVVAIAQFLKTTAARARQGIFRMGAAIGLGACLAGPLLLPGSRIIASSVRTGVGTVELHVIPVSGVVNFAFAGFYGLPVTNSVYFGPINYYETAAYVGPIALALCLLGVWMYWRRIEIAAMAAMSAVLILVVFTPTGAKVVSALPVLHEIVWTRALVVVDFFIAALAGIGFQVLWNMGNRRLVRRRFAMITVAAGVCFIAVGFRSQIEHLVPAARAMRQHSLLLALPSVVIMLLVGALLIVKRERRAGQGTVVERTGSRSRIVLLRVGVLAMGAVQLVFLLTASGQIEPSSQVGFVTTPGIASLAQPLHAAI